jgi:hypothetical protein
MHFGIDLPTKNLGCTFDCKGGNVVSKRISSRLHHGLSLFFSRSSGSCDDACGLGSGLLNQ